MSAFFDATNRNPQSCDFSGNASIVPNAPSPSAAQAAATSCLANLAATFTPTSPATTSGSNGGSGGGSGGSGTTHSSGSVRTAVMGISLTLVALIGGGIWTLVV